MILSTVVVSLENAHFLEISDTVYIFMYTEWNYIIIFYFYLIYLLLTGGTDHVQECFDSSEAVADGDLQKLKLSEVTEAPSQERGKRRWIYVYIYTVYFYYIYYLYYI